MEYPLTQHVNNGNFWETQSDQNIDRLFTDAALLWQTACSYFTFCKGNPLEDPGESPDLKVHAFSLRGLCLYLGCPVEEYQDVKRRLEWRREKLTAEEQQVLRVMMRIDDAVYQQQFIYAAGGLLIAPFIAMELHLGEKKGEQFERIRVRVGD